MESPMGEKSEVPAEERSGKLTRFAENPGLRFRSTANLDKREDAAAATSMAGEISAEEPSGTKGRVGGEISVGALSGTKGREQRIMFVWRPSESLSAERRARFRERVAAERRGEAQFWKVAEEKEEEERLLKGGLTHETTEGFSKASLKWLFVVLNLVVEVCQATLTQEAGQGKMRHQLYLKLSIATSSFCLVMSLVEAFHQGRSSGVKWQWRSYCGWFYYPGSPRRLFGRFSLYFGIICSMVQLLVNLITKLIGEDFVKFDYVPLLLSACYLVARIIASENKTDFRAVVNCKIHGRNPAKTVDRGKTWLCECPKCQEDIP